MDKKSTDKLLKKFISDLERAFEAAMSAENFTAALKAKELLGKYISSQTRGEGHLRSVSEMSLEEIEHLIESIEKL